MRIKEFSLLAGSTLWACVAGCPLPEHPDDPDGGLYADATPPHDATTIEAATPPSDASGPDGGVLCASPLAQCGQGATACTVVDGCAVCSCAPGYAGTGTSSCTNINECADGSHACSHTCEDFPGGYSCACPRGWVLDSTRRNCLPLGWDSAASFATDVGEWDLASNAAAHAHVLFTRGCSVYGNLYTGGWNGETTVSAGPDCSKTPKVAIDAADNALALWAVTPPADDGSDGSEQLWTKRYPAASPDPTTRTSVPPYSSTPAPSGRVSPLMASLDDSGLGVIAWGVARPANSFEVSAAGAASRGTGPWTVTPLEVDSSAWKWIVGSGARDAAGNVILAGSTVASHGTLGNLAWVYRYVPGSGSWERQLAGEEAALAGMNQNVLAFAVRNNSGIVLWQGRDPASPQDLTMARTYQDGSWSASAELVAARSASDLAVAASGPGQALAFFVESGVLYQTERGSAGWSIPTTVDPSAPGTTAQPSVVVDDGGDAFVTWVRTVGASSEVWGTVRWAGSAWSTPARVGPAGPATVTDSRLVTMGPGAALAVWSQDEGFTTRLWSARIQLVERPR